MGWSRSRRRTIEELFAADLAYLQDLYNGLNTDGEAATGWRPAARVRARLRGGPAGPGGFVGYPLDELYEEVAFIAYHFHWSLEEIMSLEHAERRRWVSEISRLNQRLNDEATDG